MAKKATKTLKRMAFSEALTLAKKGIHTVASGAAGMASAMVHFADAKEAGKTKGLLAYGVQVVLSGGREQIKALGLKYPKLVGRGKNRAVGSVAAETQTQAMHAALKIKGADLGTENKDRIRRTLAQIRYLSKQWAREHGYASPGSRGPVKREKVGTRIGYRSKVAGSWINVMPETVQNPAKLHEALNMFEKGAPAGFWDAFLEYHSDPVKVGRKLADAAEAAAKAATAGAASPEQVVEEHRARVKVGRPAKKAA